MLHFIHALLQKQSQTPEIYARCLQISHEIFPVVQNGINFAQKVPNFAYFVQKNYFLKYPPNRSKKIAKYRPRPMDGRALLRAASAFAPLGFVSVRDRVREKTRN